MCRYIYRDYIKQQTHSEFCSRFLPVERQLFFSVLSPSARWWMLGLCKYINWGGWSRPAPVWKCCEITFVVEWWYEFKDGWLVGWFEIWVLNNLSDGTESYATVRTNVGKVHFCKTTDQIKMYVSLCRNFTSLWVQYLLFLVTTLCWFRLKKHLVRVQKTSHSS